MNSDETGIGDGRDVTVDWSCSAPAAVFDARLSSPQVDDDSVEIRVYG